MLLPFASERYLAHSRPGGNSRHSLVPALLCHIPLAAVSWVSHETPPSSPPAVGGEERREGDKAKAGKK